MTTEADVLVLDTHTVIWWSLMPDLLSKRANKCIADAEILGVPTIVFWEASLLVRKGRLALKQPVDQWAGQLLTIRRLRSIPLSTEIALLADTLQMHPDPADRFIVASAMVTRGRLLTKDKLIRPLKFVQTVW